MFQKGMAGESSTVNLQIKAQVAQTLGTVNMTLCVSVLLQEFVWENNNHTE